jgi:serine/threonine protein kinase
MSTFGPRTYRGRRRGGIMPQTSAARPSGGSTPLQCPHCHSSIEASPDASGKLVCPKCHGPLSSRTSVPTPAGAAARTSAAVARTSEPARKTAAAKPGEPGASTMTKAIADKPTLGEYAIIGELGRGGMGRVFKAVHKVHGHVRAIKVLSKHESRDPKTLARFQREAKIIASMNHPNIVKVFEFNHDADRGYYYIVMEFVDGGSVGQILKRKGRLPWHQATEITLHVAMGMAEMNRLQLVHRDIKPSNILIDKQGTAKLADLGLARQQGEGADTQLTATGAVMGTIDYMAPEQVLDARQADIRSDLYALGCTLFHMLTGRVPFHEGSPYQRIQQQLNDPLPEIGPLAPDVPFQLVLVVNRLTEKDPANRYQTAEELAEDLKALAGEPPTDDSMEGSTIMQLQALAEAVARGRSGGESAAVRTQAAGRGLPAWALVAIGAAFGGLVLAGLWAVIARVPPAQTPSVNSTESSASTPSDPNSSDDAPVPGR